MMKALADGETNPAALAALADKQLRATPEQLCDALWACTDLKPMYRWLLKMALEQLQFLEQQVGQLDQEMAVYSVSTGMQASGWRRCRVGVSIPPSRSLPKSVPRQRCFLPRSVSPLGLVPVPATKRAQG